MAMIVGHTRCFWRVFLLLGHFGCMFVDILLRVVRSLSAAVFCDCIPFGHDSNNLIFLVDRSCIGVFHGHRRIPICSAQCHRLLCVLFNVAVNFLTLVLSLVSVHGTAVCIDQSFRHAHDLCLTRSRLIFLLTVVRTTHPNSGVFCNIDEVSMVHVREQVLFN